MAKRKYGAWSEDDMSRALHSYRNGDMGFNECCRQYGIPKPTFNRHLRGSNVSANEDIKIIGRQSILPIDVENELVNHILKLESLMFGLTINDVRRLAFQIAEKNNIPHNFNKETQMAGKKWFYAFKSRHGQLALREPQATSLLRVKGFNKENVYVFFDILEKLVDDNKVDATRIFNVDESGLSTVQNKCQKILGQKGKKQIGTVSSGERGVNTTVVCCASASGNYVPPMLIFKRMRMSQDLKAGAPPGGLVEISESGYMTSELFVKWLVHFVDTVKPTQEKKVILLLDGHTTHSKNLEAVEYARNHGVIMFQLPGHTTHRVQPLDRSFFRPLKCYFNQAIEKWLRTNPGMCVTQYQIAGLCTEAYGKAATIENATNGFRISGVWPVDRLVFKDSDFVAADNLNQIENDENQNTEKPKEPEGVSSVEIEWPAIPSSDTGVSEPSQNLNTQTVSQTSQSKLNVSIQSISPIPRPQSKSKKGGGIQKATVLTSSPYKAELEMASELKLAIEKVKELKAKMGKKEKPRVFIKKEKVKKGCKKMLKMGKTSSKKNLEIEISTVVSKKGLVNVASSSSDPEFMIEIEQEEWYCSLCDKNTVEDMIQCQQCLTWKHESCAGIKSGIKMFICEDCKE